MNSGTKASFDNEVFRLRRCLALRYLLLVSIALLIGSASDTFAQRRVRKPTQRKATVSQVNTLIADPLLPRLPPKYVGDSAGVIYQRLAALSSKLKRANLSDLGLPRPRRCAAEEPSIDEKRSAVDRLSFVHGFGKESYDADTQTFTSLRMSITREAFLIRLTSHLL
jgi:hypothetical protein